jgi:hypothetical protein
MPESSIPPQVPKRSVLPVVGTLVAVLGAGSVVFVLLHPPKGRQAEPLSSAPSFASSSAPPIRVQSLPPPPPPPPPAPPATTSAVDDSEKPLRPSARDATSVTKPGHSTAGRCASPCDGITDGVFQASLRQKAGLARHCYDVSLRQNSSLQGKLTVRVRVGSDGKACDASIAVDGLHDPALNKCVVKQFEQSTYPTPRGGCVDAEVPLNFVPQQ